MSYRDHPFSPGGRVRIVAEDLLYLRSEWVGPVGDQSLRRGSPILRRILVENDLQRAWKEAGFEKEPLISTASIGGLLAAVPLDQIRFASAGGVVGYDMQIQGAMVLSARPSEAARELIDQQKTETIGLGAYVEAPCLVIEGQPISRRVLIKFVANKVGGAHFDPQPGRTKEENLFALLAGTWGTYSVNSKSPAYYELLAIGQALVQSPDIGRFLQKVLGPADTEQVASAVLEKVCDNCQAITQVQLDFVAGVSLEPNVRQYPNAGYLPCLRCGQAVDLVPVRVMAEKQIGRVALTPQPDR